MNTLRRMELQRLEYEARRLRAQYAQDLFVCALINFDLAVRKLAFRLRLA